MAYCYDFFLILDSKLLIQEIRWNSKKLKERYEMLWNVYVGHSFKELAGEDVGKEGVLYWHNVPFNFTIEVFPDYTLCFLEERINRELYLEQALNHLNEGVQIYDQNGNVLYFDDASKKLVGIDSVEGVQLLDIYDLSEEESTVMTVLRSHAPALNRFTHYNTKYGQELITVNNARPIIYEENLIGVMNMEENITLIEQRAERLEELQQAMKERVKASAFSRPSNGYTFQDLIGSHPKMTELKKLAKKVAAQDNNIMIVGETGTGKEILAQSIHRASRRNKGSFIALNCAALPESLIESILFGTAKGSFTGSVEKPGLLEEANHGTLFLDELNSMSLLMQSKVLRALQEGTFRRVGGNKEIRTDVRVISSCNEDVFEVMEKQKLRSDLFYRLATIILEIPPLRDRLEDIEELVLFRIDQSRNKYAFPFTKIDPAVLWHLQRYSWPGNVRELFHVVDYAMNVASDTVFRPEYLPGYFNKKVTNASPAKRQPSSLTLQEQIDDFEASIIEESLRYCSGNVSQTAKMLGLQRQSLQYRLRKFGIRL